MKINKKRYFSVESIYRISIITIFWQRKVHKNSQWKDLHGVSTKKQESTLRRHKERFHEGKTYGCGVCDQVCAYKRNLVIHCNSEGHDKDKIHLIVDLPSPWSRLWLQNYFQYCHTWLISDFNTFPNVLQLWFFLNLPSSPASGHYPLCQWNLKWCCWSVDGETGVFRDSRLQVRIFIAETLLLLDFLFSGLGSLLGGAWC